MFFIIIALSIIAAVVLIAILLKINFIIEARDKNWSLSIRVFSAVVIHRRYEVRRIKGELLTLYSVDKKEKRVISITDILRSSTKKEEKGSTGGRRMLFGYINKKSKYELRIILGIGLEDALLTAFACGLVKTVLGSLMVKNVDLRHKVSFEVRPVFQKPAFSFHGDCIITLSLANIIIGYMIYKIKQRR